MAEPDGQLEWERRAGRPAGLAATLAAGFLMLGLLYPVLVGAEVEYRTFGRYLASYDDPHLTVVPSVLQAVAYLAFAFALYYLARATRARRAQAPGISLPLAISGPALNALSAILLMVATLRIGSEIADLQVAAPAGGGAAELIGNEIAAEIAAVDIRDDDSVFDVFQVVDLIANLLLGLALVLVGLNAMRAGLLSRFVGVLGIIVGVLTVLFRGAGIIEAFWLAAIGLIFLDRWPSGRGPAWESGEATPWPSAMDQRMAREELEAEEEDEEEEPEGESETRPAARVHSSSRKRKRKRR